MNINASPKRKREYCSTFVLLCRNNFNRNQFMRVVDITFFLVLSSSLSIYISILEFLPIFLLDSDNGKKDRVCDVLWNGRFLVDLLLNEFRLILHQESVFLHKLFSLYTAIQLVDAATFLISFSLKIPIIR